MKIDQVELDNKLNTLFIHSPGSTAATVQMWFRAGSALEQKDNQGIAHFLEEKAAESIVSFSLHNPALIAAALLGSVVAKITICSSQPVQLLHRLGWFH
jgi:hypothetical protein